MRTPVLVAALTAALLVPAAAATAASGSAPDRAGLSTSSGNGGDNGWGNCGNNSSSPRTDDTPGHNGGYKKGDDCTRDGSFKDPSGKPTTDPGVPTGGYAS